MKWSVDDIYNLVKFLIRKNQAGGVSASDLFNAWNSEQNMYYQDIVGRWQNRSNNKSGPNTGLILNETILTELAPFTIPVTISVSSGIANKPVDFVFKIAIRVGDYKVDTINPGQRYSVVNSVIDPPSVSTNTYYAIQYEDYYELLPDTVSEIILDYVASPENIKWGFTFDTEGRQVYNPGTSVQPKWDNPTIITITKRALINLGVSFKDRDFSDFGRVAQQTGD